MISSEIDLSTDDIAEISVEQSVFSKRILVRIRDKNNHHAFTIRASRPVACALRDHLTALLSFQETTPDPAGNVVSFKGDAA